MVKLVEGHLLYMLTFLTAKQMSYWTILDFMALTRVCIFSTCVCVQVRVPEDTPLCARVNSCAVSFPWSNTPIDRLRAVKNSPLTPLSPKCHEFYGLVPALCIPFLWDLDFSPLHMSLKLQFHFWPLTIYLVSHLTLPNMHFTWRPISSPQTSPNITPPFFSCSINSSDSLSIERNWEEERMSRRTHFRQL